MKILDDFGITLAGGRFCRLGVPGDAPEMPWGALGCFKSWHFSFVVVGVSTWGPFGVKLRQVGDNSYMNQC